VRADVPCSQYKVYSVVEPSLCVVAQGSKEFLLGESRYRYDPLHYLLVTVDLPNVGQVLEASKERPFLSLRLDLAPTLVGEVGHASLRDHADVRAISVSPLDGHLLDAMVRVARLLDAPDEARVLLPLLTREIIYRLLRREQGARLRHLAILGGYTPHIARAIERLRQDFDQPLRIEQMARELGMSVSGLHHHFKAVTALSPLQFQKRLQMIHTHVGPKIGWVHVGYKGGKWRDIDLINEARKPLYEYLRASGDTDRTYVFPSQRSERLTEEGIHHWFRTLKAGATKGQWELIHDLTFHDLRHDFAHRAREAGWSLEEVAYYLGHVTKKGIPAIQTTVRYTQVSREQVKEKLKRLRG
jgi:integrase